MTLSKMPLYGAISALSALIVAPVLTSALTAVQPPDAQPEPPEQEFGMAEWLELHTPGEHHAHLKPMAGTFTATVTFLGHTPDAEPQVSVGTQRNRLLFDGRFLEGEHEGEAFGRPFQGRSLLGYDAMRQRYVGLWIDSWSTNIFHNEGTCDADGKVFTMSGTMDMGDMGQSTIRGITKIVDDDTHTYEHFESWPDMEGERKVMEITYRRVK